MRYFMLTLYVVLGIFLVACGDVSSEKVLKKLDKAWTSSDGYEIEATMAMNIGVEAKEYAIEVWHTDPEFYRVKVSDENDMSQLILRNEEGVYVVTPSTNKSYKFQSEWPHKNSQAYLLEGLLAQIQNDKEVQLTEQDKSFVFVVGLEDDKSGLAHARIEIDKKTLKPKAVALLDEQEKEQVTITFKRTDYKSKHSKEDYALEKYSENEENSKEQTDTNNTKGTTTYYPTIEWEQAKLSEEQTIRENGIERTVLSYSGDKAFTLMQQPTVVSEQLLPVSAAGEPAHVGPAIGAMTDTSISWQQDGKEFFIASTTLTIEEMLEVAGSLVEESLK